MSRPKPPYDPPKELWFQFHPNPVGEDPIDYRPKENRDQGELWDQCFLSKEAAESSLREDSQKAGWIIVGPYKYQP